MVFSSTVFLFVFLPAVCAFYFLTPRRLRGVRNGVLLVFSLAFYFYGEGARIWVLLLSIFLNYVLALLIARGRWKKGLLFLAVAANLCILAACKYLGFLTETCNSLLGTGWKVPEIVMPLGISFFTFQGLSYVVDVYRGAVPQRNPANVALYISLFPQLIAGPIVRYESVAGDLTGRKETLEGAYAGLRRFVLGLAKKVLLANTLGETAAAIFALPSQSVSTPMAWLGAVTYGFQIYYDFSGYSDMAIGLGSLFGFSFPENFRHPYCAKSITEFWRRWHISLGSWFRDYVYIPLGGSRRGRKRQLLNLLIVWFLTGLWHGASWNFVLWGLYFAALLILEKWFLLPILQKSRVLSHVYCLVLVAAGWILFAFTNLSAGSVFLKAMFVPTAAPVAPGYWTALLSNCKWELLLAAVCATPLLGRLFDRVRSCPAVQILCSLGILALLLLCTAYLVSMNFNPFLYFRF